jgi:hypothetical protein
LQYFLPTERLPLQLQSPAPAWDSLDNLFPFGVGGEFVNHNFYQAINLCYSFLVPADPLLLSYLRPYGKIGAIFIAIIRRNFFQTKEDKIKKVAKGHRAIPRCAPANSSPTHLSMANS